MSWNFKEKNPGLSRRRENPGNCSSTPQVNHNFLDFSMSKVKFQVAGHPELQICWWAGFVDTAEWILVWQHSAKSPYLAYRTTTVCSSLMVCQMIKYDNHKYANSAITNGLYHDGHSSETWKANGALLRKCQMHGKFVCGCHGHCFGRHGLWLSLSNPITNMLELLWGSWFWWTAWTATYLDIIGRDSEFGTIQHPEWPRIFGTGPQNSGLVTDGHLTRGGHGASAQSKWQETVCDNHQQFLMHTRIIHDNNCKHSYLSV